MPMLIIIKLKKMYELWEWLGSTEYSAKMGVDMMGREISPGLWYIGAVDSALRACGNACYTEDGMMYNSYLMDAGEQFILFGAVPERYLREWLAQIEQIAKEKRIGWCVMFGTEDDRACSAALLAGSPETVLVGGTGALYKLEGFTGTEFERIEVRTSRSLTLGSRHLRFEVIPDRFETSCVYVLEQDEKILLTAGAFGSACADSALLVSALADREAYYRGAERYYADVFGKQRRKGLEAAAAFVREQDVRMICPAHGPVADCGLERLLGIFTPEKAQREEKPVLGIIYAPGDYMGELAKCIASGAQEAGALSVRLCDLSAMDRSEIVKEASGFDTFLFGTPCIGQDAAWPVWEIVSALPREVCEGKKAAVFASGGQEAMAAQNLRERLAMLGFDLTLWDCKIQGKPDKQTLKNASEYGYSVGCSVLQIPNLRKPTMVKCLVCGEIFDASLGICPVCGVGLEQCVPVNDDDVLFKNDTQDRYVIMGGGVAAVAAAEAIRRRDESGRILMFSRENCLPINRPMLTKDLEAAAQVPDTMFIHPQEWYDEKRIELKTGCAVTAVDVGQKTVTLETGETLPYDKLIYAAGAECFVPPFAGHDKKGVITIRHLTDSALLGELMKSAKKAVVIGGGVLGLEAASELMRSGLEVTVLEATPQIIGRQVDAETAAILKKRMEALHVACYEGVSIAGIEGGEWAAGVRLADGRVFEADFVVVSCGNRANVAAAKEAGIQVDRSIVVNERMETSVPDVYACGDCAQFDGMNYQLWQEASGQGRVAGANAAGERVTYANQLLGLSLEGFDTELFAIGDPGKKAGTAYRTVETKDSVSGRMEKYWFCAGQLQGAVLIGAPQKVGDITRAVIVHAGHDEMFS